MIGCYGLMTVEELAALYARTMDESIAGLVVEKTKYLVEGTLRRYRQRPDWEDILQEGRVAVFSALRAFDPAVACFSTFAVHYINGRAQHWVRDRGGAMRLPAWLQDHFRCEQTVRARLAAMSGRMPTDVEVADAMGTTAQRLEEMEVLMRGAECVSLDEREEQAEGHMERRTPASMVCALAGQRMEEMEMLDQEERLALGQMSATEIARRARIPTFEAKRLKTVLV